MRGVARVLLAALVVGIGVAVPAGTAAACSCGAATEQEHFDVADAVFEANVFDVDELTDRLALWTFEVTGVVKGDVSQTERVYSHADPETCGIEIPRGGAAYVFAEFIDGTEEDPGYPIGDLKASLCGGTRAVSEGPLELEPPVEPVAPIADSSTTTVPLAAAPNAALDEIAEPATGGSVFVFGFIAVGVIGAFVAARLAKRSREQSS